MPTNYNIPIDRTPGRLAGRSRNAGEADYDIKVQVADLVKKYAKQYGLTDHETKEILKIVEHESGFNPDAANKTSTASGVGQTLKGTFKSLTGSTDYFNADLGAKAAVRYYKYCRGIAAKEKGLTGGDLDVGAYQCYHDGEGNFRDDNDIGGKDIYNDEIKDRVGIPHALHDVLSPDDSGKPLQYALNALGVKSDEVQLIREEGGGNSTSGSGTITDKGTSEHIGSYAETPTGCEVAIGDKKVVMDRLNDSDVNLETYAKNDDGDFVLQKTVRAGDGVTVKRPFV